jgi:tetratricopeptide (TPR) repeat protein
MPAFWNVIVSNAHWMFGPSVALLLLGAYLIYGKRSQERKTVQENNGGVQIRGDVVNGPKISISGKNNTVINGMTEEQLQARLEKKAERFTSEIEDLRRQRDRQDARADVDLSTIANLNNQISERQRKLEGAQGKLADIESAYAELQATVSRLTGELEDLKSRNGVPPEILSQAQAALAKGDLKLAQSIVDTVITDPTFEEMAQNRAQIFAIAGQIALENLDYAAAMANRIRAAQLAPENAGFQNGAAYAANLNGAPHRATAFSREYLRLLQAEEGTSQEDLALAYNNLAGNLNAQGQYTEAAPIYAKALEIRSAVLGERHPETANSYNNVAFNLKAQGQYSEAAPLYAKALDIFRAVLGERHPETANSYNNVAGNLNAQGQYTEAAPLYAKALEIRRAVLGERHPETARSYNNAAFNAYNRGETVVAADMGLKALSLFRDLLGDDHPNTQIVARNTIGFLTAAQRVAEADEIARDVFGEEEAE